MSNPNDQTYYFDQDQIKCHINIVKWLGIIGIILITLCLPVYVLASMDWSNSDPFDYKVKVEANQTACSYLKQFDLQDSVMLSVCHRDGEISIDISKTFILLSSIIYRPLNEAWAPINHRSSLINVLTSLITRHSTTPVKVPHPS